MSDPDTPITILDKDEAPDWTPPRTGFLPIQTNWFDRLFISVVIWVALSLVWLRFIEPAGVPLLVSNIIAAGIGVVIIWKG